jgi:hypothetical protein
LDRAHPLTLSLRLSLMLSFHLQPRLPSEFFAILFATNILYKFLI